MDCREIRKLLPAAVDRQLEADDQQRLDEHVQSCAACRSELDDLRRTVVHLQHVEEVDPPPWMTEKIMAQIRAEAAQPPPNWRKRLFGAWPANLPLGAVATVMLAVFVIVIFRSIQPELTRDTAQEASKPSAPATEPALPKEAKPPVAAPETGRGPQRITREKAAPERPAMAPPAVQEDKALPPAVPLPRAGASVPTAEQKEKVRTQEATNLDESARHEKRDAVEGMARTEPYRAKKAAPSASMRSAVPGVPLSLKMTVAVADVDTAVAQVRQAAQKTGGRVTGRESTAIRQAITVEIAPEKLDSLRAELKEIGAVTEQRVAVEDTAIIRVRIEIVAAR